jgi:hypothetical protein
MISGPAEPAVQQEPGLSRRLLREFDGHARRLRPALEAHFGTAGAAELVREARAEFGMLLPAVPYIGGRRNPLTWNLHTAACFLALHRVLARAGLMNDEIGRLFLDLTEAWLRSYPGWLLRLLGWWRFTPWYLRAARRRAAASQARRYSGDWVYAFVPGDGRTFDWGIDYTECGIVKLCRALGVVGFARYLCPLDVPVSRACGLGLTRTQTLAGCAPRCDFRFTRGGPTRVRTPWPTEGPRVLLAPET